MSTASSFSSSSSSSCFGEVERKRGDDRILKKLLLLTPNRLSGQTKHSLSLSLYLTPSLSHTHTSTHIHPPTPPPVLCTRISHWLHSSQIRSIFHPSKKKTPLSSHCSLEATHCHSHSCVTAINHPSMWNSYTDAEKTQRNLTVISSKIICPLESPSCCLTSILWSFALSHPITISIAPSWLQTSHPLSPHCDSLTLFITELVTFSAMCFPISHMLRINTWTFREWLGHGDGMLWLWIEMSFKDMFANKQGYSHRKETFFFFCDTTP